MPPMIEAKGLGKDFRTWHKNPGFYGTLKSFFDRKFTTHPAVKTFDLEVEKGEIIGLLGPNGAGKTTLMKMFSGIVEPSRGSLSILGFTPFERQHEYLKSMALVMGQKSQLWWDIPALDSLKLIQAYYEIEEKNFQSRLNRLASILSVGAQLKTPVRRLSLGERMKMELMACLMHQPKVIFLDEPTIGLDVSAQKRIREFLHQYHEEYRPTLILTSHYMADIEALCRRIVLIQDGQKAFDGTVEAFSQLLGEEKFVSFTFEEAPNPSHPELAPYHPNPGKDGLTLELRIPGCKVQAVCSRILATFPIRDFGTERMPIERVMQELLEKTAKIQS